MNAKSKVKLSAAAVIANSMFALVAMEPPAALAAACSDNNRVIACRCAAPGSSLCPAVSGCTLTETCTYVPPLCYRITNCSYQ
jgi:hypothetical protein